MKDLSVSSRKANLYAIPIVFVSFLIFIIPYYSIWKPISLKDFFSSPYLDFRIYIPSLLVGIILHELIHAAAFVFIVKVPKASIKFGFQKKTITPYVHCKIPVKVSLYRITLLAPGLLLGILPGIISIVTEQAWLLIYSIIFLIGSGGDFLILWMLRNTMKNKLVQDHPTRCGCVIQ
jgi:hypothetical protein